MRQGPTGRALQLLSLLQTHRWWSGADLAARLGVTERTVRRDVTRLRDLGYTVDATHGAYGGYRLAMGTHLPPLILDDEEAVAVAVGLRYAAGAAIDGMNDDALRALMTITQLLPSRLQRRVEAVHSSVTPLQHPMENAVDPDVLLTLAAACRDRENVRMDYKRHDGEESRRRIEPHQLVTAAGRWYLVAWDQQRQDWRTFRLDRIRRPVQAGGRVGLRRIPEGGAVGLVAKAVGQAPREQEATLMVRAPLVDLEGVLPWVDHTILDAGESSCRLTIRAEDQGRLTMTIARLALTASVTVVDPPEIAAGVAQLSARLGGSPP